MSFPINKNSFAGIATNEPYRHKRQVKALDAGTVTFVHEPDKPLFTDADTTTAAYAVDDTIGSTDSGLIYICIAANVAGDLLTDTTYFILDRRNDIVVEANAGAEFTVSNESINITSIGNIALS